MLTMIWNREAYKYRAVSCFCNPSGSADSEKRTRSSANNRYTISKASTGIPWSWSNDTDISCKNTVNSLGLSIPPCRTPYSLFNMSLIRESHFTWHSALEGGGPRVVVSTAAFHARVRGSVPGLGGLKETKLFLPHPRVKVSIVGSLRDREVACSASDRQGSNFESCVWRTVSSQSSHHPQVVLLAQFSLYVHKGGLKPDSFHFILLCFRKDAFYYV